MRINPSVQVRRARPHPLQQPSVRGKLASLVFATLALSTAVVAGAPVAYADSNRSATGQSTFGHRGLQKALRRAFSAVGGKRALRSLPAIQWQAEGYRKIAGEDLSAGGSTVHVCDFESLVRQDLSGDGLRIDYQSALEFPFATQHVYTETVIGNSGYVDGLDNIFGIPSRPMLSDRWSATRRQHRLLNPQLLIREVALGQRAVVGYQRAQAGNWELLLEDPVAPLRLQFSRRGRLTGLRTKESDPLLRDVSLTVHYADFRRTASGVRVPAHVVMLIAGEEVHREQRFNIESNPVFEPGTFVVPVIAPFDPALADRGRRSHQFYEQLGTAGLPQLGIQDQVVADEIAPGVFHLTGGTHHSLAIVQANGLVIAEAPLYPERSEAIIAWAQATFPTLPVTHVISSHHHADHSAGLRTFAALGIEIVLGAPSAPFFRDRVFGADSDIIPDRLAQLAGPADIHLTPVEVAFSLADAQRPIEVHRIATEHADDMLLTYLPRQKLILTSDLYNPNGPANVRWVRDLRDGLDALSLDVDIVAGVHGVGLGSVEDILQIAQNN